MVGCFVFWGKGEEEEEEFMTHPGKGRGGIGGRSAFGGF